MGSSIDVQRLAAFSDGDHGGNPAGVALGSALPSEADMQRVAAEVGYSETAFAAPEGAGDSAWRVRYFAPEIEVPFCGHATIALGAALARAHGPGKYDLQLNDSKISVEARQVGDRFEATLQSPPTRSGPVPDGLLPEALKLFGLQAADLDPQLPPALAEGGAKHLVLALHTRERLATALDYDLDAGAALMRRFDLTTIDLIFIESPQRFHARNAFATGGVIEDPATGAAAAALAGYLRDRDWPHGGRIYIQQGDDMGSPSRLTVEIGPEKGSSVRVSGTARVIAK